MIVTMHARQRYIERVVTVLARGQMLSDHLAAVYPRGAAQ
jgi:hypothetical protein